MDDNQGFYHHQALRQTFDTPWPGPGQMDVSLEKGPISVRICSYDGARIVSLKAYGYELLRKWHSERRAFQYGCFPMVPWVGRLGFGTLNFNGDQYALPVNKPPHALHGMACYNHWKVIESTENSVTMQLVLSEPWPWEGSVTQKIVVTDKGVLLRLQIDTSGEAFPASAGWHPWFAKVLAENNDKPLVVDFDADWQEESGENELPTGLRIAPRPGPWDDCFGFEKGLKAHLKWPGKISLEMTSNGKSMVIFNKQSDATCVNAMTQAPNAINITPEVVTLQTPLIIETFWRIRPLA
ncbi:aldose 1-epimerase [Scandinavium sp. H11S7]|uniref:Aldose 1-epimerase n=1 Tax=Scandinavium hiltneri TaxID=2926519 RepID=A0ABT2E4M5_9ENTR|nr:aldose 1-epimerase [Scandinavium hiltneri]MCS2162833.1 aldose 1-epimerase [Scandinavium hiltneri]